MLDATKHMNHCKAGCNGKNCGWKVEQRQVGMTPDGLLDLSLKRLAAHKTWNQWQIGLRQPVFHTSAEFRCQPLDLQHRLHVLIAHLHVLIVYRPTIDRNCTDWCNVLCTLGVIPAQVSHEYVWHVSSKEAQMPCCHAMPCHAMYIILP